MSIYVAVDGGSLSPGDGKRRKKKIGNNILGGSRQGKGNLP